MKLKNLMFATMVACAFTACSSDEETPTPPVVDNGTTLDIKIANVQTKADDGLKTLTALVFKADNTLETTKSASSSNQVLEIPVTIGPKKVVVVANMTIPASVNSITTLETATQTFDKEGLTSGSEELSMNSKVYNVSIVGGQKHYLGFIGTGTNYFGDKVDDEIVPVKLYRNVAKISIGEIKTGVKLDPQNPNFPDPEFLLDSIILVQGKGATTLVGEKINEWGTTFVPNSYATFDVNFYKNYAPGTVSGGPYLAPAPVSPIPSWVKAGYNKLIDSKNPFSPDNVVFYTYENTDTAHVDGLTVVALAGTFSYMGANGRIEMENRYYPFAVGVTGFEQVGYNLPTDPNFAGLIATPNVSGRSMWGLPAEKGIGVLRNLHYKITSITLNGPGYPSPFGPPQGGEKSTLDVQVQVVGWGDVEQTPSID